MNNEGGTVIHFSYNQQWDLFQGYFFMVTEETPTPNAMPNEHTHDQSTTCMLDGPDDVVLGVS